MSALNFFRVTTVGDTMIFSAVGNIGTLMEDEAKAEWDAIMAELDNSSTRHAIIDLAELDYFGSIMLYLMVRLWKRVNARHGNLAVCNASPVGREILCTAKFDSMWPIVDSRKEALEVVHQDEPGPDTPADR